MQRIVTTQKLPKIEVMPRRNGTNDVFLARYIGEAVSEMEGFEQTEYEYDFNELHLPASITQAEIEEAFDYYLELEPKVENTEDKVKRLEEENKFLTECIIELSEVIYNG